MEEIKKDVQEQKKMSYEELNNVANQLSMQNRQLYAKLQEVSMGNVFKRLDYLFKVIENGHAFNDEFFNKCVAEIEELLTLPDKEESEESDNEE